jgi:hypothetical protein
LILLGLAALLYFRPGIIPFLQSAIGLVIWSRVTICR